MVLKFIGAVFLGYGYAILLTLPISLFMMLQLFMSYVLSIKKLNEYRRNRRNLSRADHNIVYIAKLYLSITLGCFGPTIIWQVSSQFIPLKIRHQIDVYVVLFVFYVIQMQSMISPFVFITVNQPAKRMVREFIERYILPSGNGNPAQHRTHRNRQVHPLPNDQQ